MPYKYFSTQRPVGPGTFPKPAGNKVLDIWNFNGPVFCEQIGREAWGYVVYEKQVPDEMLQSYEMRAGKRQYTVKVTAITTLTVEAESEDEATDKACGEAWKYDADEMNAEVVEVLNG